PLLHRRPGRGAAGRPRRGRRPADQPRQPGGDDDARTGGFGGPPHRVAKPGRVPTVADRRSQEALPGHQPGPRAARLGAEGHPRGRPGPDRGLLPGGAGEVNLRDHIRTIPDFPVPGIRFRDITPLVGDAAAFAEAVTLMTRHWIGKEVEMVDLKGREVLAGYDVRSEIEFAEND